MPVDFPAKPGSAYYTNKNAMINVWLPSVTDMSYIGSQMWSSGFASAIHKIMGDPMQAIISYHTVPCTVPASQTFGQTASLHIGNVPITNGTTNVPLQLNRVLDPFVDVDLGYVDVAEDSDTYMDYDGTTIEIFLPFIGVRQLDTDICMGRRLTLRYRINVMTGNCVAMIKVGTSLVYSYNGYCAVSLPYSSADFRSFYGQLAGGAMSTVTNAATGNYAGAAGGIIGALLGAQVPVSKSGNVTGDAGIMAGVTPYLIIKRPAVITPPDQASIIGNPIFTAAEIGDYTGYIRVRECHLEAVPGSPVSATVTELQEIEQLLKEGVIV